MVQKQTSTSKPKELMSTIKLRLFLRLSQSDKVAVKRDTEKMILPSTKGML
jgi:hypothetical protein